MKEKKNVLNTKTTILVIIIILLLSLAGIGVYLFLRDSGEVSATAEEGMNGTLPTAGGEDLANEISNEEITQEEEETTIESTIIEEEKVPETKVLGWLVTFVGKNGEILKTESVLDGMNATAPSAPVITNWVFTGWDKTFNNITSRLNVNATYKEDTNNNGIADVNETPWVVTFKGKNGETLQTENILNGMNATAPSAPVITNWVFTAWDKEFNNIISNLTVTAIYKADINNNGIADDTETPWIVTFKGKDGETLKTESVLDGMSATAPTAPVITNWIFTGWDKAFTNVKNNLTITAIYKADINNNGISDVNETPWSVTFIGKDGTTLKVESVLDGMSATAPSAPVITNWVFTGWDKAFNNVKNDLTVTAIYKADINNNGRADDTETPWLVTFVGKNGETLKTENVLNSLSATAPSAPTITNWIFTGWDKGFNNITSNLTVTAIYKADINNNGIADDTETPWLVTFVGKDGTTLKTENVLDGMSATAPSAPVITNWVFTTWDKEFTNITSDLTVTAIYKADINNNGRADDTETPWLVTFVGKNGETLKTENVLNSLSATAPSAPTITNWIFTGWDKEFTNITSDLTVTAIYKADINNNGRADDTETPWLVTFVGKDGTTLKTENVLDGMSATAPSAPVITNWVFTTWDKEFTNITSDLTVTAIYKADINNNGRADENEGKYTIIFDIAPGITSKQLEYTNILGGISLSAQGVESPEKEDINLEKKLLSGWSPTNFDNSEILPELALGYQSIKYFAEYKEDKNNNRIADDTETPWIVTFVGKDGTTLKTENVLDGMSATAPSAPAITNWVFTAWDKEFTNITSDLTVTAIYKEDKNNNGIADDTETPWLVTFVGKNGETLKTENVLNSLSATAPSAPTITNWIFTGWDKGFNNITSNLTVTAIYKADINNNGIADDTETPWLVTFVGKDGTTLKTENVLDGMSATAPLVPLELGSYTFTGWDKEFANIKSNLVVTTIYEDKTNPTITASYSLYNNDENAQIKATITDNIAIKYVKIKQGNITDKNSFDSVTSVTINSSNAYEFNGYTENDYYTIYAEDTNNNVILKTISVEGIAAINPSEFADRFATIKFGAYQWSQRRDLTITTKSNFEIVEVSYASAGIFSSYPSMETAKQGTTIAVDNKHSFSYTISEAWLRRVTIYVKYAYYEEIAPGVYSDTPTYYEKIYKTRMTDAFGS